MIRERYRDHTVVIEKQGDGTWLAWIDREPSPAYFRDTQIKAIVAIRAIIDEKENAS